MHKLFPIIRRVRRPLILEDGYQLPPAEVEPPKVPADGQLTEPAEKTKSSDGENSTQSEVE
jgi:hypothetical protein